jgi:hypothetical protein
MKKFVLVMFAVSLAVAGGISYFASPHPDGLERVAEDLGFIDAAREPGLQVLPDYTVPGLEGFFSNGIAGMAGVIAVFGTTMLIVRLTRKKRSI